MTVRIIIMCKAPMAGAVKTRLMSSYSADQAAQLHMAMASTVIKRAKRLFDSVVIAADDIEHPFFNRFELPLLAQGEGDLGQRMQKQMQYAFSDGASAVLLLGTDSPHMDDERLLNAVEGLQTSDVVIGPVEDGGYDLLAFSKLYTLFDGVEWSSGQVLAQTLSNIHQQGFTEILLPFIFDVDFPEDIERAIEHGWKVTLP
ncbi:MAG: TIGR04282 family arsenosugar biosynthesis glycosyltransferase [Mariprofundus sp.]|nr:TIGR04282 family arsenosugar biosynthesis glycosyltransferase [Mariprofundus sp.]